MMVLSCAIPADSSRPSGKSTVPARWSLELMTSGGFTGRGLGNVKIESRGPVTATDMTRRTCEGTMLGLEKEQIEKFVAAAAAEEWKGSYARPENPYGAADQVSYSMTLEATDAQPKTTSWFDENISSLPPNLTKLRDAAWAIRKRVMDECTPK